MSQTVTKLGKSVTGYNVYNYVPFLPARFQVFKKSKSPIFGLVTFEVLFFSNLRHIDLRFKNLIYSPAVCAETHCVWEL